MPNRCRLCTTNDREALIEELAAEMWGSRRRGTLDDVPLAEAGSHWQRVFREFAETTISMLERGHGDR